ncbi:MAG TPA: hypothetical protein PKZ32_08490 [Candidatus Melainabacteria bacterium]|nr:hypothetical protein [Candidatus Melainabacteria bacterium]
MKARKFAVLCAVSSAILILVEAMPLGMDLAAAAQNLPQSAASGADANSVGVNNGRGRGRRKGHRRHRRRHMRGMNGSQGSVQSGSWQNALNSRNGSSAGMSGGGRRRHRRHRHRGGGRRRMMQMNGADTPQDFQPGGRIGQ